VNPTTNICMLGAGRVGRLHTSNLTRYLPGGRVAALVDPAPAPRQALAQEFGVDACFDRMEQALDGAEFDAVVITTPTPTHRDLAVQAAEAGKHVFLEKPMALNLLECNDILQATRSAGVLLQIGFMRRFDPEFTAASERIQAGEIGQPMMIKSLTHGPGLPPPWARDLRTSNGMLAEVNSHDWDTVRWLMGSNYERVYVETANFKGQAHGVDTLHFYDNVLVNLRFESGGLGSISGICPCGYGYDARVEIVGEKGILQIGALQGQDVVICTDRDQGLVTPIYRTWPERFTWGYIHEMEHYLQCIQTGTSPRVSGEDGRWAVAGVLAGTKSFLEERPVQLWEILV
jgi:predicted dehydrogenase